MAKATDTTVAILPKRTSLHLAKRQFLGWL